MFTRAVVLVFLVVGQTEAQASPNMHQLVVRERASARLLDGAFTFKLAKIAGYTITVRIDGKDLKLKIGQSFSPENSDCRIVFDEIATETRLAKFSTNCR